MSGSQSPSYHREFAYVPDVRAAEIYVNDNAYGANNAPNAMSSFIAYKHSDSVPSILGSASKMSEPSREEIQAQIAASEARGETKLARLESKMDLVISKIDGMNTRFDDARGDAREARTTAHSDNVATRANIWVAFIGLIAAIIAICAIFPTFFDIGSKMRDAVEKEVTHQMPQPGPTTKKGQ
jgi:hypothetical protein